MLQTLAAMAMSFGMSVGPAGIVQDVTRAPPPSTPAGKSVPPASPQQRTVADVIAADVRPSVCRILKVGANGQVSSHGSGFVVSADGFVITNEHVVEGATALQVEFPDEALSVSGELWQAWPQYDLALVKVSIADRRPAVLSPGAPQQAEDVYTLGFPLDKAATLKVTRGIVSSMVDWNELSALLGQRLTGYATDIQFVQIDSVINPGNSGGPLINGRGQVIGVNTLKYLEGDGVFYAVSAEHVSKLMAARATKPAGFTTKLVPPPEPTEVIRRPAKPPVVVTFPRQLVPGQLVQPPPTRKRQPSSCVPLMLDLIDVRRKVCSPCAGDGKLSYTVRVGTRGGRGMQIPILERRFKTCIACKGGGRTEPETADVRRGVERAVKALAELEPSLRFADQGMADVARRWEAVTFENVVTFGDLQSWSAERLKAGRRGDAVLAVGAAVGTKEVAGRRHHLVFTGQPNTYLITGQVHEEFVTDDAVIVAGVIGDTLVEEGRRYVIVHGGLIIDVPTRRDAR